jgi:Spy/CpxP family protein refolding chaperone
MNRPLSFVAAFGVAAMLLVPAASFAQTTPAPYTTPSATAPSARHHRGGSRYMRVLRSLNLSDAQRQQIRAYMRASQQQLRTQIEGVLTPEQRTQLRSSMQQPRSEAKPAT